MRLINVQLTGAVFTAPVIFMPPMHMNGMKGESVMRYRMNRATHKRSIPEILTIGTLISGLITVMMAMIIAFMVGKESVSEEFISTAAVITIILSSFISAMVVAQMITERAMVICLACGAIYYVCLLCGKAILFRGEYQGLLGTALTIIGCDVVAVLVSVGQKAHSKPSYKRKR